MGGEAELDPSAESVDGPREADPVDLALQSGLQPLTQGVDAPARFGCEDLGETDASGRHGQCVAVEGAADGEAVGVAGLDETGVVVEVGADDVGDLVGHADDADGDPSADALPSGEHVRLKPEGDRASAVDGELDVGLVDDEDGARSTHVRVQ